MVQQIFKLDAIYFRETHYSGAPTNHQINNDAADMISTDLKEIILTQDLPETTIDSRKWQQLILLVHLQMAHEQTQVETLNI